MSFEEVFFYAALQGVSEFLPVSSSAHLLLLRRFFPFHTPSDMLEIAAHLGSLCVLYVYFFHDILRLVKGGFHAVCLKKTTEATFFMSLLLATLPAIFIGFLLEQTVGRGSFNTLHVVGWTSLCFGTLLYFADQKPEQNSLAHLTYKQVFWGWGFSQCLAFVYGVSRSGSVITFGRFMKYSRESTVRFAFLMAIPTLQGAVTLKMPYLLANLQENCCYSFWLTALFSFCVGLMVIYFLMHHLNSRLLSFLGLYRIILGIVILCATYLYNLS